MRVQVAPSQAQIFQKMMAGAKKPITDGALVRVDLLHLVTRRVSRRTREAYFNARGRVRPRCFFVQGNGAPISERIRFEGIVLRGRGEFAAHDVFNVMVDARDPAVTVIRPWKDDEHPEENTDVKPAH
ncbi:MAG: hypothetical protein UY26_C0002G0071 [Candidatus Jorgensenbacteria bacterium GW2011_GWA1_48_13]|uniref:Uncharacterized protein n=2 Tax=Candidatus Joergenseniibacteriota TaxID=1752739 RepID=A0A0G1Z8S6_9BACT|nr:MAG: hypothetical protein UY26_C0002G0071 [Candidatus Jorgensenbacteria bacterium GW2011_GWA1_48_13]KKU97905.1 MAG: hypothetical protein UY32_C0038G0005 [Candidatus Jorgensenbacteria bacterium GW2011_GWC1_48_8]KKW15439.1 MAG: hypothetical protein UY55_C0001G0193 [Candidatus Jorgensenbacteria bacterium GW2011_GWB1_50_10]